MIEKSILEEVEAIYLQVKSMDNLTDERRMIIGEKPMQKVGKVDNDYDDDFDEIVTISKNAKEELKFQKKIDEWTINV